MAWTTRYDSELKIIELTYTGFVSPAELAGAFAAVLAAFREHSTRKLLADCTDLLGGHSVIDIYELIKSFDPIELSGVKDAMLMPTLPASAENALFFKSACDNIGINVRICATRQEALDWLAE